MAQQGPRTPDGASDGARPTDAALSVSTLTRVATFIAGPRSVARRAMMSSALFLVGAKLGFKFFLLIFTLIVARHLSKADFGDFQFVVGVVNVLTQPAVLFSMIAVKVGYSFAPETRRQNLRWLLQRSPVPLALAALALLGAAALGDGALARVANVAHPWSFLCAAGIVIGTILFNYLIGFLQAIDRFRAIGLGFLVMGALTVGLGVVMKLTGLDVRAAYAAQIVANGGAALLMFAIARSALPREGLPARTDLALLGRFSVRLLIVLIAFFGMLNLDIFVAKLHFSRDDAGWYLRHEFIAKLCFVTASALAVVIFPRTLQHAEAGRNPAKELRRSSLLFALLCAVMIGTVMLAPQRIFALIYGDAMTIETTVLVLLLGARLLQSSLFMLINYAGTNPTRPLVAVVGTSFLVEFLALAGLATFGIDADTPRATAAALIAGVAGGSAVLSVSATVILLLTHGTRRPDQDASPTCPT